MNHAEVSECRKDSFVLVFRAGLRPFFTLTDVVVGPSDGNSAQVLTVSNPTCLSSPFIVTFDPVYDFLISCHFLFSLSFGEQLPPRLCCWFLLLGGGYARCFLRVAGDLKEVVWENKENSGRLGGNRQAGAGIRLLTKGEWGVNPILTGLCESCLMMVQIFARVIPLCRATR